MTKRQALKTVRGGLESQKEIARTVLTKREIDPGDAGRRDAADVFSQFKHLLERKSDTKRTKESA